MKNAKKEDRNQEFEKSGNLKHTEVVDSVVKNVDDESAVIQLINQPVEFFALVRNNGDTRKSRLIQFHETFRKLDKGMTFVCVWLFGCSRLLVFRVSAQIASFGHLGRGTQEERSSFRKFKLVHTFIGRNVWRKSDQFLFLQ